jgi:hypothetical protein
MVYLRRGLGTEATSRVALTRVARTGNAASGTFNRPACTLPLLDQIKGI